MAVRLPRPSIAVHADPHPVRRVRIALVRRIASAHASVTTGRLLMPVLAVLDRLLPPSPLPALRAELAQGVEMRLDGAGAVARSALIGAGYEHREVELLATAVRPGGLFVDVGANIGWFSLLIAHNRPESAVWAIEPIPATADLLTEHVRAAGLDTVRVLRCAVGATRGSALFEITSDNAYAHRTELPHAEHPCGGRVRCDVAPLDELWREAGCPRVDAVKIDVEGVEVDVLAGARALLARDRPMLVVEVQSDRAAEAVTAELAPHGYRRRHHAGVLPYNACFYADS
ncbi:FkbM family methyltransferase [Lentzea atacamensis]|uniref:FkbM family methyltransferase n=1 Tax=Lentzea atacamensis TaxID=531938 RepID=A0A316IAA1_9PSEU|nr:FkbM family methyltransferase [Lentzea atacamensis]PWK89573.1 FkbM family methyltransferase [Lentzea atacamensis]RAS60647.1 FkbM family methyltransferase [Lentzea atacamensis]